MARCPSSYASFKVFALFVIFDPDDSSALIHARFDDIFET